MAIWCCPLSHKYQAPCTPAWKGALPERRVVQALGAWPGHSHRGTAPLQACSHLLIHCKHPSFPQSCLRTQVHSTLPPPHPQSRGWSTSTQFHPSPLLPIFLQELEGLPYLYFCVDPEALWLRVTSVVRPLDIGPASTISSLVTLSCQFLFSSILSSVKWV